MSQTISELFKKEIERMRDLGMPGDICIQLPMSGVSVDIDAGNVFVTYQCLADAFQKRKS